MTLEGTEGVGKSTNLQFISAYLKERGIDLLVTREPGGTPLAEELRHLLLKNREESFDPTAELLTVFAARAQHLNSVIRPALSEGRWVLSDRFTDATYAYQGAGRCLDLDLIERLEMIVQGDLRPDTTILLDIDVVVGLERARNRAALDRFEQEELNFFERVRQGYADRVAQHPDRYEVVDAARSLDQVQASIKTILDRLIAQ